MKRTFTDAMFPGRLKIRRTHVLSVLILVAAFLLFLSIRSLRAETSYAARSDFGREKADFYMRQHAYGVLIGDLYSDGTLYLEDSQIDREAVSAAVYADAAVWYRAFSETGDTERAEIQARKMEEALTGMEDYREDAVRIRTLAGIRSN